MTTHPIRRRRLALVLAAGGAMLLAACTGGSSKPSAQQIRQIDRALVNAPGQAQPGKIVAVEVAFSRAARETGQWTAYRQFAAPRAVLHEPAGPVDAAAFLSSKRDPAEADQWGSRAVWMSCDGQTAVSTGRFIDAEGLVGNYVAVWERQSDGNYRWVYETASPDNPQPPPKIDEEDDEDVIVVQGLVPIQGRVADCSKAGEDFPVAPIIAVDAGDRHGSTWASDRTLRWGWRHAADGTRHFRLDYRKNGVWETPMEQVFGPEGAGPGA